ncbi:hypothetical protein MOLA_18410 [Moorella thermoacetica]|nr:hypothetical protein MOLA_18410 [Moorella thermoacetica]
MGVHKNRRGAAGEDGPGELGHRHHTAFHMDMAIHETRAKVIAAGVNHLRFRPHSRGYVTDAGNAAIFDGDIPGQYFAGKNVYYFAALDNGVGREFSGSHSHQFSGDFSQGTPGWEH